MTEITPVPESVRKAYKEQFCPFGLDDTLPDGGVLLNKEALLQFIAAYGLECEREGYVKGTDAVWKMIAAQRESAVREVIKECEQLYVLEAARYADGIPLPLRLSGMADLILSIRGKFLPTSLTPETHDNN